MMVSAKMKIVEKRIIFLRDPSWERMMTKEIKTHIAQGLKPSINPRINDIDGREYCMTLM